jgi:hypothetical protein
MDWSPCRLHMATLVSVLLEKGIIMNSEQWFFYGEFFAFWEKKFEKKFLS